MNLGPLHFSNEINITGVLSLTVLVGMGFKLIRHLTIVNERVEKLWQAVMGEGPQDEHSFFYRFSIMEQRVSELWARAKQANR
jgi:hypothetical protein